MSRPVSFGRMVTPERRQSVILAVVLLVAVAFVARLVYVQAIAGPALADAALDQRSREQVLHAPRGDILAADGTVLATSFDRYTVVLDLNQLPQYRLEDENGEVIGYGAAAAASQLAPILGLNRAELGARLVGDPDNPVGRAYHVLARGVTPEVWQQIATLDIDGLTSERSPVRTYPHGSTAGPVIGWANAEQQGAAGLESALDTRLTGTDGMLRYQIGASGQVLPTGRDEIPAVPGCDVQLTIDADLQYLSERVVTDTADRYGAEWAAAVVLEVGTGDVLAIADSNPYDPADPPSQLLGQEGIVFAPSVQAVYEPGSTGKVLTTMAALEEGVVTPTTPIQNPYRLTVENGQSFTDFAAHPDQVLTTTGVLAQSANTGTVNIGELMSDQTRFEYMQRLGWGQQTGIGLPGEASGQIHSPDTWDGRQRYTTMFGQGLSVSLLQNTGVFAAIANQGIHLPPRIIEGYDCPDGFQVNEPTEPTAVFSPESSQQMIRMLESVIEDGTGTAASVEGYRVAGKTGTAQTADGAGGITATTASFVGIAPADDPAIVVGVVVYKPTSGFFGGTIAAPAFAEIAAAALTGLGVPPSTEAAQPYPLTPEG